MSIPKSPVGGTRAAVRTHSLSKRYGSAPALIDVDLAVPEGAVCVLAGPNGAGKTTFVRILLDVTVADSGSAEVFGLDTHRSAPMVRAHIGCVPERDDSAYGWMRVADLIRYHAAFHRSWDAAYASELARLFEIRGDARMASLSKGQQRRVQLLLAMAHCPPLLILDEPTDGLDPLVRDRTLAALADHMARLPTTLLISTHQVHETERLCDHLCVLQRGRVEVQLSRESLRRGLRRYWLEVPAGWNGAAELDGDLVHAAGGGRELAWTVWGDESRITASLGASGAAVRRIDALTLQEAVLALLEHTESAPVPAPGQPSAMAVAV
jgi:ABC-2 type transport system ATP-binding protein